MVDEQAGKPLSATASGVSRRTLLGAAMAVLGIASCGSDRPVAVPSAITELPAEPTDPPGADPTSANPGTAPQATAPSTVAQTPATMSTVTSAVPSSVPSSATEPTRTPQVQTAPSSPGNTGQPNSPVGGTLRQPTPPPKEGTEPYQQIGTIQIPAIGLDAPLGEGVTIANLNKGPEHWPGTAMPGEVGNVVVGGHRVSHTHPFLDVDKLNPGDQVIFDTGTPFVYLVTGTTIVLADDVSILTSTNDYTGTLFACTPKHQISHRIVIHLRLQGT